MDTDVCDLLLALLSNAPLEVRGHELAALADVHSRAVAQVSDAKGAGDDEGGA